MARHTDTWIFNIDSALWSECLGHSNRSETGNTESNSTPIFGFTADDKVSQQELQKGDLVLARIVSEDSGIAAIWRISHVVPADESTDTISDRDFDWLIYCDVLQKEFNSIYRENWERFAEVADTDVDDVEELTSRNIVNLRPEFKQTYIDGLLEHNSVTQQVREQLTEARNTNKNDPKVWIEKTEIEGRPYKKEGDLRLGNAIYSKSQDKRGNDRYATLRTAKIGDIVLHLLQDEGQLVGISVIESELETDFEGLPEFGWTDEQSGYRRWLTDYEELDNPIDIYDDVLGKPEYREQLDQVRNEYENIFYDKNYSLVQGGYFTQCPKPLANVLSTESAELRTELDTRGYTPESPTRDTEPVTEYDDITELTEDIDARIERTQGASNWLYEPLTEIIVRDWSTALSKFDTKVEVTADTVAKLEQIRALYENQISNLEEKTTTLQSGTYNSLSRESTLFIGLFRMLQVDIGESPNLNPDKLRALKERQYSIKTDEHTTDTRDHPLLSHLDSHPDATVYKFTAPPDYWLTAIEYRSLPVEASHADNWRDASPGDIALFHSQASTSRATLNDQAGVVFGVGIFGDTYRKDGYWLPEGTDPDEVTERSIAFKRVFVTSDIKNIDLKTDTRTKSVNLLNTELDALTANGLPIDQVNTICLKETNTGFPDQGAFMTFRQNDGTRDRKCPRAIITTLAPKLTEIPPVNYEKPFTGSIPPDAVLDGLYFPGDRGESIIEQVGAALRAGDHIILTGPPGTGKTEIADRVATYLAAKYPYLYSGSELTTATADWSTFDTVGGYMPTETSDDETNGDLAFTPGIILNRLKDTQTGVQTNEPIIIDELNRADIDKGFGQLFTLLSGQSVQLPFTRNNREIELLTTDHLDGVPAAHQYVVPDSWRIFATMNTYDKTSLYEMSYAFMRRFAFIRVPAPEFSTDDDDTARSDLTTEMNAYIDAWDGLDPSDEERDAIGQVWKQTNQAVDDRSIGPAIVRDMLAYVTNRRTTAADELSERVTEAVISYIFPQLEGVPERKQIITHIAAVDATNTDTLRTAASDMLQVTIDTDTES